MLATILRESFTSGRFARIPESELVMDSAEAVSAFARAGQPNGILSGVHTFYIQQVCQMICPGDRVLDLGCGPASLLASVAALNRDARFTGVDLSGAMIATATESVRRQAVGNVDLRMDDMTRLSSIESASIDVVLSSMALHHLPDTEQLRRCFEAIERVMAPGARVFLSDFGRIRSLKSLEYFVSRAIPGDEPVLERDYRASLRAAFSREEFATALPGPLRQRISIYSTVVSPLMVVLMTPFPVPSPHAAGKVRRLVRQLPCHRRADLWQLRLFLRLGGMPCR